MSPESVDYSTLRPSTSTDDEQVLISENRIDNVWLDSTVPGPSGVLKNQPIVPILLQQSTTCEDDLSLANQSTLSPNVSSKKTKKIKPIVIEGYRIVHLQKFLEALVSLANHSDIGCTIGNLQLIDETTHGLQSKLRFRCNMCNIEGTVSTCPEQPNEVDINTAAVLGIMNIGAGFSQMRSFLSSMDVPSMGFKLYQTAHNHACNAWENVAWDSMKEAAKEEARLAIESGSVSADGTPMITVVTDGTWAKRSYRGGGSYNSSSGAAVIVGFKTRKVLFLGVKNKFCIICHRANTKGVEANPHPCYLNWTGSSTAMESAIIAEGFCRSEEMYHLIYSRMIADGDSSCYRTILDRRPYRNHVVEKIECRNHLLRNYCNKLTDVSKTRNVPTALRNIVANNVLRARTSVTKAVQYRKNEDLDEQQKIKNLKHDILNSISHIFGEHKDCCSLQYFCKKTAPDAVNYMPDLRTYGLEEKIMVAVRYLANHSKSLIVDVDNNTVEQFNSIVAKYTGGKRINFTMKRWWQSRCMAAVVSRNVRLPLYKIHKHINSGKSPGKHLKSVEAKRVERLEARKTLKSKRKLTYAAITTGTDKDYGNECQKPDLDDIQMAEETDAFLKTLERTDEQLKEIEKKTRLQADSTDWRQHRRHLLTASLFGKVCKMRPSTSCKSTVRGILYKEDIFAKSVIWGKNNEDRAKEALANFCNIEISDSGLVINVKWPYLGASPDGVGSDGSIIEIKCPYSAREISVEEGVKTGLIKFLEPSENSYNLKLNHEYYYQVQGQLNICNKEFCHFGVWTTKNLLTIKIFKDTIFFETKMLPKLNRFYHNCLLPEIVDPRHTRNMEIRDPDYIINAKEAKEIKPSNT